MDNQPIEIQRTKICGETPTPSAARISGDRNNLTAGSIRGLDQLERAEYDRLETAREFGGEYQAFLTAIETGEDFPALDPSNPKSELFSKITAAADEFFATQRERLADIELSAEALMSQVVELKDDTDLSKAKVIEFRPGAYAIFMDPDTWSQIDDRRNQGRAVTAREGVSFVNIRTTYSKSSPDETQIENIPHEFQHHVFKAVSGVDLARDLNSGRISIKEGCFHVFQDEALAKIAGGASPMGYNLLHTYPQLREHFGEAKSEEMMSTIIDMNGKLPYLAAMLDDVGLGKEHLILDLYEATDFDDLKTRMSALETTLEKMSK